MKTRVLLATTVDWPSTARLAGAFAALGAAVDAVFPAGHVIGVSRHPSRAYRYRPLNGLSSFARAINAAAPDLVVPCDDRALALLLKLKGQEVLLSRSLGALKSYPVLMTRSASLAIAREEGITAPETLAVPDRKALGEVVARVGLPCVMKADGSWGGDGVIVAHTLQEAEQAFARLQGPPSRLRSLARAWLRRDLHFVGEALAPRKSVVNVQAFVPGKPATSAFACRNGEVLASLHMDVVDWKGATGPASLMRRCRSAPMEQAARKIAARFGLSGFIGLDFVRDHQGVPHLIEINPRATQICHLALGPDLPAALLGLPPRPCVTEKLEIALFPQLLEHTSHPLSVHEDMPWDDPAVAQAFISGDGPDMALEAVPRLLRAANRPPVCRL